jgi:hypothetical protein
LIVDRSQNSPGHLQNTLLDGPARLPAQLALGAGGVGAALLGVVDGHVLVDDVDALGLEAGLALDLLDNVLESQLYT